MKRPVVWSRDALDDVKAQIAFIATHNPGAARRVADRLRDVAATLGETATGRPGRVAGTYEKLVPRLPYVIAYALDDALTRQAVVILRVIHAARDWPLEEWPE